MLRLSYKKVITAAFVLGLLISPLLLQAQSYDFGKKSGLNDTASSSGFTSQDKKSPEGIIQPIVAAVLSLVGILFLGLAIFGGIQWMTARGNEQQIEKARSILTNAIIGLIVVAGAYALSYFILRSIASQSFKAIL